MIIDIVKVFVPSMLAFAVGIILTPWISSYLYKHEMWKKKAGKVALDGSATPIFNELHKEKEVGTPRMGGIIIWLSAAIVIIGVWLLASLHISLFERLDFLSRNQTWIPLSTLILGALVGMIDDLLEIKGSRDHVAGGLSLKKRLLIVGAIGLLCASWFYFKLGISQIGLPFHHTIELGILFIPFFIFVVIALYSGGVIDGLDGLAGGTFAAMFAAYAGIAFYQNQINLAAFCTVLVGGILAFLWFNIPPARFYMSETGSMALTVTLAVVAFMTDHLAAKDGNLARGGYGILVLPIIALPLVLTAASVVIQLVSKKLRGGKKVFLVAPLHHHFEALGWPAYKVTMRYWIIGIIFAILGMILALLG
jgi:phospho-N-acetylmuramoyl-pentapeptide-transferase